MSELTGAKGAGQALAWAVAWARKAGHPLTLDRLRPTLRAIEALTRAVAVVASWGPSAAARAYRFHHTEPVAAFVSESMRPPSLAGWNVSVRATWKHLRPFLPGIDSIQTFHRRLEDAPPHSVLGELHAGRTEHGIPAELVLVAGARLASHPKG